MGRSNVPVGALPFEPFVILVGWNSNTKDSPFALPLKVRFPLLPPLLPTPFPPESRLRGLGVRWPGLRGFTKLPLPPEGLGVRGRALPRGLCLPLP